MLAALLGWPQATHASKVELEGDKARVTVLDVDAKNGKIRLSIRATKRAEERAEFEGFLGSNKSEGKGLGTLGDLFKKQLGELRDKQ